MKTENDYRESYLRRYVWLNKREFILSISITLSIIVIAWWKYQLILSSPPLYGIKLLFMAVGIGWVVGSMISYLHWRNDGESLINNERFQLNQQHQKVYNKKEALERRLSKTERELYTNPSPKAKKQMDRMQQKLNKIMGAITAIKKKNYN